MPDAPEPPLEWTPDGLPRSRVFGDVYFSAEDGLAETRAVFLEGCGLPDAWAGRRRFVVAELGFGTGLNVAALLDLWRRRRPAGGQLHVFSVEAFPVAPADAARALSRWPELAEVAARLTARWPGRARGVHRVELPEFAATLDVAVMQAADALAGWRGRADAWFLDGFAPSVNPQMWTDALMADVAARSAPGARAATFTVAGQPRRALAAAGFAVAKRPGFGRKRERLEARLPGRAAEPAEPRVAIVGAGIAGASASRALRALGAQPLLIEAERPGAGASGNLAALVTPRLDAGLRPAAALYAQTFARAIRLYDDMPAAIVARGVTQIAVQPRDARRFATLAASDLFEPGALAATPDGLVQTSALVVEPATILSAWTGPVLTGRVKGLEHSAAGWRLTDAAGCEIATADAVLLANALDAMRLAPGLPMAPARGQASFTDVLGADVAPAAWGGYVAPTRTGLLFGATYDRGDTAVDVRAGDHLRNLEALAKGRPDLAVRLDVAQLAGRAAIRAATPDRLPLAGPLGDGVWVLAGFGARGFTFAPQLAEHVAAGILGAPSPLLAPQAALVAANRFAGRIRS